MYQVYNNLFVKDENTIRMEKEREERRIQREEWLKIWNEGVLLNEVHLLF